MNGTFFCSKCGASNSAGAQFCSRCGAPLAPLPAAASATAASTPGAAYGSAAGYASAGVGYGGFWIRVVATIVDAILVRVVLSPFGLVFGGLGLAGMGMHRPANVGFWLFGGGVMAMLGVGANWLYEAFMESSSYQATLGKMIFGMKVTDLYGNRISFGRATGRHFAKYISGFVLGIGFIMVGFTERKQGLHDIIAGTLVRK
jgi:uncharacterized RDD family membrane protein YckC